MRAKTKIREAKIPFGVPERDDLPSRLESVLRVIYLVFNEGYFSATGNRLFRIELSSEAIRLARILQPLIAEPEIEGLLALMLLTESRREARTNSKGDLIPLEEQNRALWNLNLIEEGSRLVNKALSQDRVGAYTLQAAISDVHCNARHYDETDWNRVVTLYSYLMVLEPSPVVKLNLAVALAMRDGPESVLATIDELIQKGGLSQYHLAHATRADLHRRTGNKIEASVSHQDALRLAVQEPERRFIRRRLAELE